ncbi:MAG: hypothetical protein AB7P37_05020 [Ramlibacter sp.]
MNALGHRRFTRFAHGMCCVLLGAVLAAAHTAPARAATVPLPRLGAGPVELRVAYAINPRLPRMDAAQLATLLDAMRGAVREHFGVELRFAPVKEVPLAALFATIPAARRAQALKESYDFKSGRADRAALDRAFAQGFRDSRESLPQMIAFAQAHTGPIAASHHDLGRKVAALQLARVQQWAQRKALDGGPAIDDQPFNEFPMWLALGFGDLPYELVLTNQLIAGVEYTFPAVHTAIRGGYSNGITSYGRLSRFGTFSVWSTYAFTADDDDIVKLRGGERYTPEEAARLAGLSGAHEIGHQLFHFTHPFGQPACLMSPVPMFGYRAWAEKLSAKDCPIGSSPAMTPGQYKFEY